MSFTTPHAIEIVSQKQSERNFFASLIYSFGYIKALILPQSKPEIQEYVDGSDRWWYLFDPYTGCCIYASSEAELRFWLEQRKHGL